MLPKGNFHQNGYFTYRALCAVIHGVWIAAFLSLAEFTIVLYHTPFCAPILLWARISYISGCYNKGCPHCRSPPSDFDFAYQLKKSKLEELPMKEINLRDYYPFYTQDVIVEVPDEVANLLREYKLAEAAYILRTYRHKAYFSLDYDTSVERDALVIVLTPAEILEQQEENARLYQALASLPEKQRNRITSHFLLGMSLSEFAKSEGSGVSSVHEGIQRGLRRLKKVLEKWKQTPKIILKNEMNNRGTYSAGQA